MFLIIDDNKVLCRSIVRALRVSGMEGRAFTTWSEAREELELQPLRYHYAVIDYNLQHTEMTGQEVMEWIRYTHPHIRCLLISGVHQDVRLQEPPPYQQFLQKPFGIRDLVKIARLMAAEPTETVS